MADGHNNPRCEKQLGVCVPGEVRVLPTEGESGGIVCKSCFEHEIEWRDTMNDELELEAEDLLNLPSWEDLAVLEP